MMELDIKQPELKNQTIYARVPQKMVDQIDMLVRKHKIDRSVVIRSLIEAALKEIK